MIGLDYDKVLSPEDKSAVARLAVHQPRRKVEASVTQAETQVAQMTSEDFRGGRGLRRHGGP